MKKLIFLFIPLYMGCEPDVHSYGEIIKKVVHDNGKVSIKVKFQPINDGADVGYIWFEGSDTCKVGQIVNLK